MFAQSIIKDDKWENFVQRTVDSSRFFALLLVNEKTGQRANIGLQFPERNDSFDFVQALDQFKKYYREDKGIGQQMNLLQGAGSIDFSLKEGEKITVSIKGISNSKASTMTNPTKSSGLKKLALPGSAKPAQPAAQSQQLGFNDLFSTP